MDIGRTFRELHTAPGAFIIPNPWDVGSAKFMASLGFKALATTSAGHAFSRGQPDGGISFHDMIIHCREMSAATDLPVSADLEHGKGDSPESAEETIFAAEAAGLAGCSIEDSTGDPDNPIYEFDLAVERVAAAAEATRSLDRDFVFTARAENFLHGKTDVVDTIARLQAFERAGADVVYAPGLREISLVKQVCSSVSCPVNVLTSPAFSVEQLTAAGASRISLGSLFSNAVYRFIKDAAAEMLNEGSFTFATGAIPHPQLQKLMSDKG
ncbi:MAG: isocitrate lyase/phosphoenolpyruvate mutase family protein [Rhizobiaceae bacterium]